MSRENRRKHRYATNVVDRKVHNSHGHFATEKIKGSDDVVTKVSVAGGVQWIDQAEEPDE